MWSDFDILYGVFLRYKKKFHLSCPSRHLHSRGKHWRLSNGADILSKTLQSGPYRFFFIVYPWLRFPLPTTSLRR